MVRQEHREPAEDREGTVLGGSQARGDLGFTAGVCPSLAPQGLAGMGMGLFRWTQLVRSKAHATRGNLRVPMRRRKRVRTPPGKSLCFAGPEANQLTLGCTTPSLGDSPLCVTMGTLAPAMQTERISGFDLPTSLTLA